MTRFFVDPDVFDRDTMVLSGENAQHAKVLRLKEGEIVLVCDGQGQEKQYKLKIVKWQCKYVRHS